MKGKIIAERELHSYFNSLSAYIVGGVFLFVTGWFFVSNLFLAAIASIRTVVELVPFLFLFFIPAITMGSFTEERKTGTIEMLFTLPVTDFDIIAGKFLSNLYLTLIILSFTLFYPITLFIIGDPDLGEVISQYIGLILLASAYISIGMAVSSFSSNQVVSFIITFLILFLFFIIDKFLIFFPDNVSSVINYISVMPHFHNIIKGVIDSTDLVYFFSLIIAFLYITLYSLERRHWNG